MAKHIRANTTRILALSAILLTAVWTGHVLAHSSGMIGKAQNAEGCNCHSTTPNANGPVTVLIDGPTTVAPNAVANYTVTVYGGPADSVGGGFNLEADGGTLIAGANNQLDTGELTHVDRNSRSWDFSWQAPATEGTVNFYAIAQSVNGSSQNGDSWNWFGGAVSTPFAIAVSTVGVGAPTLAGLSLSPPRPNPFVSAAQIDFVLARSGPVRLEIFDLAGRRVTSLVNDALAAGPHVATWDGRDAVGRQVDGGVYLLMLEAGGERLTEKVIRASR